jgi:hypothetical protein
LCRDTAIDGDAVACGATRAREVASDVGVVSRPTCRPVGVAGSCVAPTAVAVSDTGALVTATTADVGICGAAVDVVLGAVAKGATCALSVVAVSARDSSAALRGFSSVPGPDTIRGAGNADGVAADGISACSAAFAGAGCMGAGPPDNDGKGPTDVMGALAGSVIASLGLMPDVVAAIGAKGAVSRAANCGLFGARTTGAPGDGIATAVG